MGSTATQARQQIDGAKRSATRSVDFAQQSFRRHVQGQTEIRMVAYDLEVEGRHLHYGVSNNQGDPQQLTAVNLHGFFCGGRMYDRESERLAEAMGWRLINPSLPGFGGSDPLAYAEISLPAMSRRVEAVLDHLGIERAILLGHSMGAAVAVDFASTSPERVLGIVYRDGIATPTWSQREGIIPLAFSGVAPDLGPVADLSLAVVLDLPDLLVGRMLSTVRSLLPDLRRNVKTLARTAPLASMLMEVDLTEEVAGLREAGIPVLAEWGCFDRIVNAATAAEFAALAQEPIQWIPGGHSWMLARPSGQTDVLRYLPAGKRFVREVNERAAGTPVPRLRAVRPRD